MGTSLVERLNGKTFQAKNELYNKQVIQVYVENEEDVPFWKFFFDKKNLKTIISPADKGSVERGKQSVLAFSDRVNKYFVLCVDSDFDYLLQSYTSQSKLVTNNPYIFHTYIHSIESFKCYSGILHKVVVDATLNDTEHFDYIEFLENYSKVIFELFILFFYFEKKHQIEFEKYLLMSEIEEKRQTISDYHKWKLTNEPIHIFPLEKGFNKNIKILQQIMDKTDIDIQLNLLKNKIFQTISSLPSIDKAEVNSLKTELFELGVNQSNAYLFIQGHVLMNNVVMMFLNPIFNQLKDNILNEYKKAKDKIKDEKKQQNVNNVREHYKKIVFTSKNDDMSTIERILFIHKYFDKCPFAEKIFNSIDTFIANNHKMN